MKTFAIPMANAAEVVFLCKVSAKTLDEAIVMATSLNPDSRIIGRAYKE